MRFLPMLACLCATPALARDPALRVVKDIEPGNAIKSSDLETVDVSDDGIGFVALRDRDAVVGRVVRYRIVAGSFLRKERLAPAEPPPGDVSMSIPVGMRGMEITPGYTDLDLSPGDLVDVRWRGCLLTQASLVVGVRGPGGGLLPPGAPGWEAAVIAVTQSEARDLATAGLLAPITIEPRSAEQGRSEGEDCARPLPGTWP